MKKSIIWAVIGALAIVSCQREKDFLPEKGAFTATIENTSTRTELSPNGDGFDVLWRQGDEITIVDADNNVGVYATESTTSQGVFALKSGQESDKPAYKAYFPSAIYNEGTPALPPVQEYVPGNIYKAPMLAQSDDTKLQFKNLGGIVRVKVSSTQEGKKVKSIVLTADKPLSGPFTINEDAAVVSGKDGVTLDCGEEGVAIGAEAVPFFIAVPAGTYNPFKITVITTDGEVQARASSTDIAIGRSKVVTITLNFGELTATSGSAPALGGVSQPWVQLWAGGPRWAKFNVGSSIASYADVTEYTNPDVVGGYYSYKGRKDSVPDANGTEDTAFTLWGANWSMPTMEQEQALLDNCEWVYCDGATIQFEPGCTLVGWKVSGKEPGFTENAIFLPLGGVRDQNSRARQNIGSRGLFWSLNSGGYGAYYLHVTNSAKEMSSHNQPHGCSVRAICVGDEPIVEGQFVLTADNIKAVLWQFETYAGENPTLVLGEDIASALTITRADGVIDLGGHTLDKLYLQNNEEGKAVTVRNGTVKDGIDGKDGQSDYFAGTVILEDVNTSIIWTDGHAYVIIGGVIDEIQLKKNASTPGTVTIDDGFFGDIYRYVDRYGGSDDGSAFILNGGKYKVRPALKWCAAGHYATSNPGDDSETYPYMVIEGDPGEHWFDNPATDLSADATANTYIVSEPGTYKFKATVKGNGGLDPLTGTTATPIDPADITGAAVLWELAEAGRAIIWDGELYQFAYKDGYIWFNTPDTFVPGAAYVAVYKDCDGGTTGRYDRDVDDVLWSWLIWVTEEPGTTDYGTITVMDRNLGAFDVGNAQYRGCAYAWGRKDPFPGCYNGSYTPSSYFPDRMTAFRIINFDAEGMTVAYSIAHPTTYMRGWSKRYWQTEDEYTPGMWWDGEKTIYDPSPAGWKVPSMPEMNLVRLSGVNLPGGGFLGNCQNDFGYGNPSSLYYWTSSGSDRDRAWAWYGGTSFRTDHVDNATRSGYPIRCVKEKKAEPEPAVLVQHWPFDKDACNMVEDGIDADPQGPVLAEDRFGHADGAYFFDGNDRMIAEGAAEFGKSSFSANVWVKSEQRSGSGNLLRTNGGFSNSGWLLRFNGGRIEIREGRSSNYAFVSPVSVADGQWHMLTYVRDVQSMAGSLYIDGTFSGSYLMTGTVNDVTNTLTFGTYGTGEYYTGTMDDVRLYTGILTDAQIKELYRQTDTYPMGLTDLSAAEAANSYLVPRRGKYMFKATVKGNGSADKAGISKDTDPAAIAKAELVWATFNTTTAPVEDELIRDIRYEDGYVYFSTGKPYVEGNALIAIKDASDVILWSWHLWFERDDMEANAQTYPVNGYVFMDRNLGALTNCYGADDALDFGFTYQRGRKDPFLTSATRTSYTPVAVLGTATSFGGSGVENSIKNPTVVFGYDSWGGNGSYWSASSKTIFDPCPPGWHIPGSEAWKNFNSSTFVVYQNDWNTYHGRLYNGVAWYPATGDRWGPNHNNTGDRLDIWGERELYADKNGIDGNGGSNPGHGYSIRCVKQ